MLLYAKTISLSSMKSQRRTFKTFMVEESVKMWCALSFLGLACCENIDGSLNIAVSVVVVLSVIASSSVFGSLSKKGYFQRRTK